MGRDLGVTQTRHSITLVRTEPAVGVDTSAGRATSTADDTRRTMASCGRTGVPLPMVSYSSPSVVPAQIAPNTYSAASQWPPSARAVHDAEPTEENPGADITKDQAGSVRDPQGAPSAAPQAAWQRRAARSSS